MQTSEFWWNDREITRPHAEFCYQYESPNFFGCHEFVWNYQNGSLKFVKLIKLIENWLGARIQKFFCTCVEIFCSCCW